VQKRALEEKPLGGMTRKDQIIKILYEELDRMLGGEKELKLDKGKTTVIVMLGVQGSGKTTTVSKLARLYSKKGFKVGVVAADTFRPGAITQLKTLCERIGVDVYSDDRQSDSVKVAQAGKKFFENDKNLIIIDTAGRHKEEKGLLDEMKSIVSKVNPDINLLIIDGTIGQQCYNQAEAFHKIVPVGGIIITKLDSSAKGGGALAAAAATGAKIMYIGTGERIDDLEKFSPTRFVGRMLGMGDIQALLDMAARLETEGNEERLKRISHGKMNMEDFYFQIEEATKAGGLRSIMENMPGISGMVKEDQLDQQEERMEKWRYVIQSMTKEEKADPDLINASRVKRIARGSGWPEHEVKELLKAYKNSKTMMKASKGRQLQGMLRKMGLG
jgi:signal recognition particle subunit SRP54